MNSEALKATLRSPAAENERLKLYQDTVGKWTIGVGRNLTDNGIRRSESEFMLDNDVTEVTQHVSGLACWQTIGDVRQRVLAEMCFQLGFGGLRTFKKMFRAIDQGDFEQAADEMLNSKWAKQTPGRAWRLSSAMRTNQEAL